MLLATPDDGVLAGQVPEVDGHGTGMVLVGQVDAQPPGGVLVAAELALESSASAVPTGGGRDGVAGDLTEPDDPGRVAVGIDRYPDRGR